MNFNTEKGKAEKCHFCMNRLDAGKLPACVITCLGVTLEYGDYNTLKAKYPNAQPMGSNVRILYDNLGGKPQYPTNGYPDPRPCHSMR
jgi:Fe-S-cluster-containing dehydrogenase component